MFLYSVSHFKMEDEAGEIFDNTYLTELKSGAYASTSPPGRESIR